MPKTKLEGWKSPCNQEFPNRKLFQEHCKDCLDCKKARIEIKLAKSKFTARCGEKMLTRESLYEHQRICQECRKLAWKNEILEYPSRCGMIFNTQRERDAHLRICEACAEIKQENIQLRMEKLNEDNLAPERKKIFSDTARKTSMRPELLKQRSENLKKWREENPEEFAKCTEAAYKSPKRSKMEAWLRTQLNWTCERIRCGEIQKQVDFVKENIWIEVDGFYHFFEHPSNSENQYRLPKVQARDQMLNEECIKRANIMLLRLSMECFHSSTGAMRTEIWKWVQGMLRSPIPGIWCIGKLYESCPWVNATCSILKLPTQHTTSCCQMAS